MPEKDFVDIARRNAGVGQRFGCDTDDQAFDSFLFQLTKGRVSPTNYRGG